MEYKLLELRSWMIDEDCGVYEMLQEIPAVDEFEQHNEFFGLSKAKVKQLIDRKMQLAYGFGNDQDNPKCENYVLFVDKRPVVIGGLMLEMTDYWKMHRGHFFYKTRPSDRKKGYCTRFLEMLIERAKQFGFTELFGQCDIENVASQKVMLNNGFEKYTNPLCTDWDDTNFNKKTLL